VIAQQLVAHFQNPNNIKEILRLLEAGVQFELEATELPTEGPLMNARIVVSGVFETLTRTELKTLIEELGGTNVSSISSKTTYVVAGDGMGPSKKEKAEKLGIPVLDEASFLKLIGR